jgi:hypothetical protein
VPTASAGSSKGQCSFRVALGKTGHLRSALPQTVTTKSKGWVTNSSSDLLVCRLMSMPISAIASTANGLTPTGVSPAL